MEDSMSVITDIASGLTGAIGDAALKIRIAITGIDPAKQAEIQELTMNIASKANQAAADLQAAQVTLDTAEAGVTGTNFFKFWVAGWRPFIGWVCGSAFVLQYVVQPVANWCGAHLMAIDMGVPTQVVLGMLGLSQVVTRTVEKIQSAAGNH
jgi:hypothetical protein